MIIFFRIAFRNTLKNWRKSLAAIASIAVAFLSLVVFQGYIHDVKALYEEGFSSRAMYGNLIIENKDLNSVEARIEPEKFHMTAEEQAWVQAYLDARPDEITNRVRFLPIAGTVNNGRQSYIFVAMGHDIEAGAKMREPHWVWDTLYGKPLHLAENPDGSVVLGQALGLLVGCVPVNPPEVLVQNDGYIAEDRPFECENSSLQLSASTFSGQVNALDLNVVGLIDGGYKDVDERWMKLSLTAAQTLMNTDQIRFMSVRLKDERKLGLFVNEMNEAFSKEGLPLRAVNWIQHPLAELYQQTTSLLRVFQIFIVCIIMMIVGLSVFNTMVKNVKERTREIGMLRSLGYRRSDIMTIFSLEAAGTCLVGVGVGAFLAVLVTVGINQMQILYNAGLLSMPVIFRIAIDAGFYFLCAFLLVVLAIATSFLAVRSTLRTTVAENLTHV